MHKKYNVTTKIAYKQNKMQNQTNKKLNNISNRNRIENKPQRSILRIAICPMRHILFTASAMADMISRNFFFFF